MPFTFTSTGGSGNGLPGKDSLFLGTWNSVNAFLAVYQGGPVGLPDGDWWAFVKDNANPNKVYVAREDANSATGWVIDDNESFLLPAGTTPFTIVGEYNNGLDYGYGAAVYYNGGTYVRTGNPNNPGYPPTVGSVNASWTPVAEKGAQGEPGAGFGIFYLGNYNPNSGYVPDIAVVRGSDGQLYLAKASGQLNDPVGNTAQWEVWIPKGADGSDGSNGTDGIDGENGITVAGSLDDLTDVVITGTPTNQQLIVYNTSLGVWENRDPIVASGLAYKALYPNTRTATGQLGQISIDGANGTMYVCTGTNNWQKISLNSANFTNTGGFN